MAKSVAKNDSLLRELAREAAKYVVTGLIGASAVLAYTCYRRLPSRSLSVSPGGARIVVGAEITCLQREFIAETLNAYLTDEIDVPPCTTALDQDRRQLLKEELERAYMTWHSQRTVHFEEQSAELHKLARQQGMPNLQLRGRIISIIGSFRYIANELPPGLEGQDLLNWAITRVDGQLATFQRDENNIRSIVSAVSGKDTKQSIYELEMFFLVTNTSDVEYYIPTRAVLDVEGDRLPQEFALQLEQLGETTLPLRSLRFVAVPPGMGQLLRFRAPLTEPIAQTLVTAVKARRHVAAKLRASLPSGTISSDTFELSQFMQ